MTQLPACLDPPPDLFEYKFVNSHLVNSTFLHNKEGCQLDVTGTGEGAYMVYFVSFLGTLAVLPGNIVSALLMDKIGRLRMLGKGWVMVSELIRVLGKSLAREGFLSCLLLQGGGGEGVGQTGEAAGRGGGGGAWPRSFSGE